MSCENPVFSNLFCICIKFNIIKEITRNIRTYPPTPTTFQLEKA